MAADVVVTTGRLVLRRMTADDAAALATYRSDPEQARYQSWEAPYPLRSARALIDEMRGLRFAEPGAWLQVAIETGGRMVGDVAVCVDGDDPREAWVGFTLARDAQGRGLATEAVGAVISLLFRAHGVHRVSAECDTRNLRSAALLARVGMRRQPHLRRSAWWKGEWTDEDVYSVRVEDWPRDHDGGARLHGAPGTTPDPAA